jgi:ATP-dependent helicase/nuclease subunit A
METKPTDEQIAIINELSGNFSVLASAGSGKTYVVTERYLKLINQKLATPSQILAITFTRKAAAEMKRRIVDRLRTEDLLDQAQEAETGPIQTIHSFCERILRENSIACGLDPKFDIVGTGEASRMRKQAIQKAITLSEIEDEDVAYFLQTMVGQSDRNSRSSYSLIERSVETLMDKFRSSDLTPEELGALFSYPEAYLRVTNEELVTRLPDYAQVNVASEFGRWNEVVRESLKKAKQLAAYPWFKNTIAEQAEVRGARLTCGLARLALEAWALYESALREVQMLDFNQLERRAVHVIESIPSVRKRLQQQYRYVMVDEAQDMSPIQFRIFNALEIGSKVLIGDDKQSIYLFRQADVERFREFSRQDARRLSRNFRSALSIQRFVDQVFSSVFAENYSPMLPPTDEEYLFYEDVQLWKLSASRHWRELAVYIAAQKFEGTTAILAKSNQAVGQIEAALRQLGVGTRTMGGKADFYANLEIRDLANVLTALVHADDDYALLATLRSPVVGLSLDSIVLLSAADGGARAHLYSFVSPIEEDQAKLEFFRPWFLSLSMIADRLSAWEVISRILAESQLLTNLARRHDSYRKILNVRKLLVIATQTPEMSVQDFAQLLLEIRSLKHQEGDAPLDDDQANLIVVGTVHRSKGLEWDNVIIADGMDYKVISKTEPKFDSRMGWVGFKHKLNTTYVNEYLREKQKQEDLDEVKRLQYVALTRAKKKLILVSWGEGNKYLLQTIRTGLGTARFEALTSIDLGPKAG